MRTLDRTGPRPCGEAWPHHHGAHAAPPRRAWQFCSSFQPADQALWAADATERPFGGHYRLPATFDKFCALHTAFSVEGEASEQCDEFLQRLAASSRPAPAKLCELACGDWCDPCCGEHAAESPLRCR
jgi:hypothetical protein